RGLLAPLDHDSPVQHSLRTGLSFADRRVKGRDVSQLEESGHRGQMFECEQPLQRQAPFGQLSRQQLLAGFDRLLTTLTREVVADLVACARAANKGQPVSTGGGV